MAEKVVAKNKKAYHDYFIEDTFECGIVLVGTEIKAVRAGHVQLKDSFARVKNGEVFIHNMHISPYEHGNIFNHEATRVRKLLLHRREILKINQAITQDGYTLVPLQLHFKNGFAKMVVGIGKGKKNYDKRESLKQKDMQRDIARAFKENQR